RDEREGAVGTYLRLEQRLVRYFGVRKAIDALVDVLGLEARGLQRRVDAVGRPAATLCHRRLVGGNATRCPIALIQLGRGLNGLVTNERGPGDVVVPRAFEI